MGDDGNILVASDGFHLKDGSKMKMGWGFLKTAVVVASSSSLFGVIKTSGLPHISINLRLSKKTSVHLKRGDKPKVSTDGVTISKLARIPDDGKHTKKERYVDLHPQSALWIRYS